MCKRSCPILKSPLEEAQSIPQSFSKNPKSHLSIHLRLPSLAYTHCIFTCALYNFGYTPKVKVKVYISCEINTLENAIFK